MNLPVQLAQFLAWPLTVLILAWLFRAEIISLLRRLKSADLASKVLQFGDTPLDRGEAPKASGPRRRQKAKPRPAAKWDKPATLFWLANDLMWIQDMLFRAAPRDRIVKGLKHAREYATALGLDGTFAAEELTRMVEYFEGGPEGIPFPLILDQVPYLANQVELIKRDVASRVEQSQPGFIKLRAL